MTLALHPFTTFRAASLTMARYISPRLGWRVRNAHNSNRAHSPREGVATPLSGDPQPFCMNVHACEHSGESA